MERHWTDVFRYQPSVNQASTSTTLERNRGCRTNIDLRPSSPVVAEDSSRAMFDLGEEAGEIDHQVDRLDVNIYDEGDLGESGSSA